MKEQAAEPIERGIHSGPGCPVHVIWDRRFLEYDLGQGHPFQESFRALPVELLEESHFFDPRVGGPILESSVELASPVELQRFHEEPYLQLLSTASEGQGPPFLDTGDTPAFPGCLDAAARIVGGTLQALRRVMNAPRDHALQLGGGFHHAARSRASGFCILNDVAIAIATAIDGPSRMRRVAYVDLDVHHGDGVMYGFYSDGRLLDLDLHQDGRTLFPGTGSLSETGKDDGLGLKVNVPLPPGAGDTDLLRVVDSVFLPRLREYRPELIVVQSGADGCAGDPLAQLQYSPGGLRTALGQVHRLAHDLGARLLVTGGGGYLPRNVSLVLALAAAELQGGPAGFPPSLLPPGWRSRIQALEHAPAPKEWPMRLPMPPAGSALRPVERMIERLQPSVRS